ncbi:MAG: IMP dehydrogenase [Gammaproteobacteria bacterium]|nr:MAG: IMP dehydrogenase [Gammaproteobacteria bacterium]
MRILQDALTFDDVLLVPSYSEVLPKDVNLTTQLTEKIALNLPILSAAMDTVTEARLAIALAQLGGLGIVHKNMSPEEQAKEVAKVKKFESGMVQNPITVSPDTTVDTLNRMTQEFGYSGYPVIENGELVGLVTRRDKRFVNDVTTPTGKIMTPREKLVTVGENPDLEHVQSLLHKHKIEKILVIDDNGSLKGLITVKDIRSAREYPNACKDTFGRLRVGAAIGPGKDGFARLELLVDAGVDIITVDTAHGHSKGVIDMVRAVKQKYPDLQVMGGNIATSEAALALAEAGVDAVKVGIGPGSICTTRIVAGVGVPQISAIANVANALKDSKVKVVADGGIRYSGDFSKAIVAGADVVMIGSMLAGTEEAPGEVELYQGRSYKAYRGMGSIGAMSARHGSSDRYFQSEKTAEKLVPEGIEGRVPYKGHLAPVIEQLVGGVSSSMGYCGCATIAEMQEKPRFVRITSAGVTESHVHDVHITKEAPNYRAG